MLDLRIFLALVAFIFIYIGARRGFSQEIIATAGVLLALFGLHHFDDTIRGQLLRSGAAWLHLLVQLLVFALVVYFAYHTRAVIGSRALAVRTGEEMSRRSNMQDGVLGGIIGALNGYSHRRLSLVFCAYQRLSYFGIGSGNGGARNAAHFATIFAR